MKPDETVKKKVLSEWISKADDDYGVAELLFNEKPLYPNAIAFHCQQAAEKYLKVLLVWKQISFPMTHDLKTLLNLVGQTAPEIADSLSDIIMLTPYGVEIRYPGDRPDASQETAKEALRLVEKTRKAVIEILSE